ncbi:MAG: hypothetical protein E7314_01255 [Clostridiales bacterium]|nr:hypothetical protein [Clostridiales bacterium]
MRSKIVECFYHNAQGKIKELGDLKIQYASTNSFIIKSLLRQAEELFIFRAGTAEMILKRLDTEVERPTTEEACFCEKLRKLLKTI